MRQVFCAKLKKEAEGLLVPPYPGEKGKWVYENISKEAWGMWQQHQTMLINEKHLSLANAESRKFLAEQMDLFFAGDDYEKAQGYVPPSE
ncbi:oxidative damage protection protein [Endozoicomonadaceae bacterium StTr2]